MVSMRSRCMPLTLYSMSVYEEIVAHASLKLMTKLTDHLVISREEKLSVKEQNEAMRRAWISNTEVQLLKRKTKLDSPAWQ